jgi:hypothetical protein
MFRHATNDPIAYLSGATSAADRAWMMGGDRNMWCGAWLGLAVGRRVTHEGPDVAGFAPVEVSVDDKAVVRYGKAADSRTVMRFEIKDPAHFPAASTRATAQLLESFPCSPRR